MPSSFGLIDVTYLCVVVLDRDFFLADSAPKLDRKLSNIWLVALHALDSKAEQRLLHVEAHLVVVKTHYAVQASVRALLDAVVVGLCGFADDLHDVVSLAFIVEIGSHKLNRVAECVYGCHSDVVVGLLLAGALHDGRQDRVGMVAQRFPEVCIVGVADEANRGQRGLLLAVGALSHALDKGRHELRPLVAGYLDGGHGGNKLGRSGADLLGGCGESAQGALLDHLLDLGAEVDPSLLDLA
jgi:hypothetical protein